MQIKRITFSLTIVLVLLLSACAAAPAPVSSVMDEMPASAQTMPDQSQDDMSKAAGGSMEATPADGEMMAESGDSKPGGASMPGDKSMESQEMMDDKGAMDGQSAMMETPAWFSAELVDVRSSETFRLADFSGKVVLVETLAVWCSNCLSQQKQIKALHELLGERDDFVSLGLDIDPNEDAARLVGHADKNGFDWLYAVSPVEVSRQLGDLYGAQFLNPPSTPMLIVDRHGQVHALPFGIKSAEDLQAALQPFLDEGM